MELYNIDYFVGFGMIWGIVLTSGPYSFIMSKLHAEDTVLECALCTGTWLAVLTSFFFGFHPISFAMLPIFARLTQRWIRK